MPKQAVPKRDEKPIHGLVSDKNFIVANAVENILAGKCFLLIDYFSETGLPASNRALSIAQLHHNCKIDRLLVAVTIFRDGKV